VQGLKVDVRRHGLMRHVFHLSFAGAVAKPAGRAPCQRLAPCDTRRRTASCRRGSGGTNGPRTCARARGDGLERILRVMHIADDAPCTRRAPSAHAVLPRAQTPPHRRASESVEQSRPSGQEPPLAHERRTPHIATNWCRPFIEAIAMVGPSPLSLPGERGPG